MLLLQPTQAPKLPNGCTACGPPISCLLCPESFECLMGVQKDCFECPAVRCISAASNVASATSQSSDPSASAAPTSSASPKVIGAVLGAVGGVIVLALVVFFFLWNKRHRNRNSSSRGSKHKNKNKHKKRDHSGIIIDDEYRRDRSDPLGNLRENDVERYTEKDSYKSLSTLFEDTSSTSTPKSPVLVYTRRGKSIRGRTPVPPELQSKSNYNPDAIVPQQATPANQARGLSAIFQLPSPSRPGSVRLSLGSLFSDSGRLSLSFRSTPGSSVKADANNFDSPSTARDSSLTMSSNASNIIPIAYVPGVLDSGSIVDQYSAYQERKAAKKRDEEEESSASRGFSSRGSYTRELLTRDTRESQNESKRDSYSGKPHDSYTSKLHDLYPSYSESHARNHSLDHTDPPTTFSTPQTHLDSSSFKMPLSATLSTLFQTPPTADPPTPPLKVSGKTSFVNMLPPSHSQQSSINSMSTVSFDRLWDEAGALVADDTHVTPSPGLSGLSLPNYGYSPTSSFQGHGSPMGSISGSSQIFNNVGSIPIGISSPTSTYTDAESHYISAPTSPIAATIIPNPSSPYNTTFAESSESLNSIQPSVNISRASTATRSRLAAFPPRGSSLRRDDR